MNAADLIPRLGEIRDPFVEASWDALGVVIEDADNDGLVVRLGYPIGGLEARLEAHVAEALSAGGALATLPSLSFAFDPPAGAGLGEVRHLIAVASGKGGVGKSTTAVNLALALSAAGARVGLLDADIYGPSQGLLLGIPAGQRPQVVDEKFFEPITSHGVATMSMSYLASDRTPMVWRGPMASGALQQLLKQTLWGPLDYLLIDMPPGTGDIQLTLSQQAPVSGAVIVTTPQDLALLDARKGIEMFAKVDIPTLGVVENMAVHCCPNCGHISHPFGTGGGEALGAQYGVPVLAELPLSLSIREQSDRGVPTVVADPQGDAAQAYLLAARHLAARLWQVAGSAGRAPTISISDD